MPKHSAPSNTPQTNLPLPDVIGVLPSVPGGEDNLLPKDAWLQPLRIEFDWWEDPSELPSLADVVQLIWDGDEANPVAEKEYFGSNPPVPPTDLWLEVPVSKLDEGVHTLSYRLLPWNGSTERTSVPVNVTIDKTAPVLATPSTLIFPPEVLPPNKLTAYYLEDEDQVRAAIPAYTTPKVGDVITWYWDPSSSGTTIGGAKTLSAQDYDQPLFIDIPGDWIRSQGDGDRYIWYRVIDRAGNPPNGQSAVERLIVSAQPVPRVLPPPKVVEAAGTNWPVRGTLDPIDAVNGVKVILNPASVVYPDELPRVRWAVEGELGSYIADPVSSGEWVYSIPKAYMAPHFGKTIPVDYCFDDKHGQPHQSEPFSLAVLKYPDRQLHSPQIVEGSPLSLAHIPPEGASITLRNWPFAAAGQQITIIVEGLEDATGTTIKYQVLDRHVVTEAQAAAGIVEGEALVAKAEFLARIRLGPHLTVRRCNTVPIRRSTPPTTPCGTVDANNRPSPSMA
ncbi:hypothetical protein [Pseudomonas fluorescens]|uniref:hypothetical protein n=1 Tax=Pseudomonas fluorescens TaxID=294 RepID=UPI0012426ADA|nr:hypothetical protein [Pseudomonas fluorescens]VVN26858.1 hypothetical protein PS639_04579 [Pseudomonas fluorescens]